MPTEVKVRIFGLLNIDIQSSNVREHNFIGKRSLNFMSMLKLQR